MMPRQPDFCRHAPVNAQLDNGDKSNSSAWDGQRFYHPTAVDCCAIIVDKQANTRRRRSHMMLQISQGRAHTHLNHRVHVRGMHPCILPQPRRSVSWSSALPWTVYAAPKPTTSVPSWGTSLNILKSLKPRISLNISANRFS